MNFEGKGSKERVAERTQVYDNVFRTMLERTPKLIIYLINEVFSEDFAGEEAISLLQNKHASEETTVETDSYVQIGNRYYHIECQSNPDGSMAIRMMEYDFLFALRNAEKNSFHYTMKYPNSCVLYLRHHENTPDAVTVTVEMPNGERFTYQTPIVKVQEYELQEIFEKKLLAFLPYYILKYEKNLETIEVDEEKRGELVRTYGEIAARLKDLENTDLTGFEVLKIRDYALKILDWVARNEPKIREEVHQMCGTVIRTEVDDIYDSGKKEGMEEGRNRMAKLVGILMEAGDYDVVKQVVSDPKLCEEYYERYGI
ncbi:MAG: hypothetical protein MR311_01060 [Lachnospiraceae bacterium]|nr:hypothetical protein [Lachnospiraceae bacterium]